MFHFTNKKNAIYDSPMIERIFIVVSCCYLIPKQHIHNVQPDTAVKNTFP